MIDREKVLKGLECCSLGTMCAKACPYDDEEDGFIECTSELARDALAMLKEQEAVKPHYTTLRYLMNGTEVAIQHPECPRCVENGLVLWDAEIEKGQAYCKRCGQAVKWE